MPLLVEAPQRYNKLIAQVITVLVAFITAVQMPGSEWGLPLGTAISGAAAAVAVWWTENTIQVPLGKFYAAVTTAIGVSLSGLIAGSDARTTLATASVAVLGALSVLLVPNALPASPLVAEPVVVTPDSGATLSA